MDHEIWIPQYSSVCKCGISGRGDAACRRRCIRWHERVVFGGTNGDGMRKRIGTHKHPSRRVVMFVECPRCDASPAVMANGRLVRHSEGFCYVEDCGTVILKDGTERRFPKSRHPRFRTRICQGSGVKVRNAEEMAGICIRVSAQLMPTGGVVSSKIGAVDYHSPRR